MAAQRALRLAAVVAGRAARPHIGALTRHTVFFDQKCRVWPAARGQLAAAPYLPAAARAVPPALSAWQGLAHIAGWAATGSTAGGWASPAAARRWLAGPSGPGATDAYTVLGVARGLSDREYKVAYLKLAKTCHPDMNPGDKDATARFQAVSASYEKVKDAAARARYELELSSQASRARTPHQQHRAADAQGPSASAASAAETWARASGDAAAMAEAFADWLREEAAASRRDLETDIATASSALSTRDWRTLRTLAARRAPLLLLLAAPALLLRSPAATLIALRGLAAISTGAVGFIGQALMLVVGIALRNPRFARELVEGGAFSWVLRRVDRAWSRAAHRARERLARRRERERTDKK